MAASDQARHSGWCDEVWGAKADLGHGEHALAVVVLVPVLVTRGYHIGCTARHYISGATARYVIKGGLSGWCVRVDPAAPWMRPASARFRREAWLEDLRTDR
jgi:hypothetical protein